MNRAQRRWHLLAWLIVTPLAAAVLVLGPRAVRREAEGEAGASARVAVGAGVGVGAGGGSGSATTITAPGHAP